MCHNMHKDCVVVQLIATSFPLQFLQQILLHLDKIQGQACVSSIPVQAVSENLRRRRAPFGLKFYGIPGSPSSTMNEVENMQERDTGVVSHSLGILLLMHHLVSFFARLIYKAGCVMLDVQIGWWLTLCSSDKGRACLVRLPFCWGFLPRL